MILCTLQSYMKEGVEVLQAQVQWVPCSPWWGPHWGSCSQWNRWIFPEKITSMKNPCWSRYYWRTMADEGPMLHQVYPEEGNPYWNSITVWERKDELLRTECNAYSPSTLHPSGRMRWQRVRNERVKISLGKKKSRARCLHLPNLIVNKLN